MQPFLNNPCPYVSQWKHRLLIAIIASLFLYFIIYFLKPFDIGENPLAAKYLWFIGYSLILFGSYILYVIVEGIWQKKRNSWTIKNEAISLLSFFILGTTLIFVYDTIVIKQVVLDLRRYVDFMFRICLPFAILVLPVIAWLRMRLGMIPKREYPPFLHTIYLKGDNKDDLLEINSSSLYYFKAADNYTEIVYRNIDNDIEHILMRASLSQLNTQASHMTQCHRSYSINLEHLSGIQTQKGKTVALLDQIDIEIPVSRTFRSAVSG